MIISTEYPGVLQRSKPSCRSPLCPPNSSGPSPFGSTPTQSTYGRTCQRIRSISTPLIIEHRQLQHEFTRPSLDHTSAARLLYAIARRPWIKLYPQVVELVGGKTPALGMRPATTKAKRLRQQLDSLRAGVADVDLREMILGTGLILPHRLDEWIEGVDNADDDYVFALLLAALPNIWRIDILSNCNKLERVKEIVRKIRNQGHEHRRALGNLRTVRVIEQGRSNECDLELFPLFAALPGIEDIYGKNLAGMYRECYQDGWMTYPGASPSLTHITLETCGMSVEGLEVFTRRLRKLQSFKYIAHCSGWCLHAVADLLKEARSSLQTLEISAGGGSSRYVGSLRQFTALRNLTLDTDMLMRNGRMQRAVDVLPASIEKVTLCGNNLTPPQEEKFLMDLYRPAFTYPRLKSIGVEDSYGRRLIGKDRLQFQREFHKQVSSSWMLRYR